MRREPRGFGTVGVEGTCPAREAANFDLVVTCEEAFGSGGPTRSGGRRMGVSSASKVLSDATAYRRLDAERSC